MKTLKLALLIFVIALLSSGGWIKAQTFQFEWRSVFTPEDNVYGYCLNHQIVGENTYHVVFHINPETGALGFIHYNVLHCDLTDYQTGEKLIMIDTGMDKTGLWVDWWTFIGLPIPPGVILPTEGRSISATMQFKTQKGVTYALHESYRFHIDESGNVIIDDYKARYDCN